MTEKNSKQVDKVKKPINVKEQGTSKGLGSGLTFISLFIGLAALLVAGYCYKQAQTSEKSLTQELLNTSQLLNDMTDKQRQLENIIAKMNENSKTQMSEFQRKLKVYKRSIKQLSQTNFGSDQWQAKKAQFYLQLAQINAHWSQHPETTIALLKQADELLVNQHHPDIYDIRQQIAKEIADIKKQDSLDLVGLLTQINAIQHQIQQLSYRDDLLFSQKPKKEKASNDNKIPWRQRLADNVNALEKLVVIRHHNQTIKPILTSQQLSLVKEALYVDLQQAKWALIHRNQSVFKMATEQALYEIQRHFNEQQSLVDNITQSLKRLKQTQIERKIVVPNKALTLLNELLQSQDNNKDKVLSPGGTS